MADNFQHLADYNVFDLGGKYLGGLYLGAGHGHGGIKFMVGYIDLYIVIQPFS